MPWITFLGISIITGETQKFLKYVDRLKLNGYFCKLFLVKGQLQATAASNRVKHIEMNTITLHNTLPAVFAGRGDTGSDIWLREGTFERGKHYLISAESGTGKSSLCSYIYGYRIDYSGTIAFDGRDIKTLSVAEWCTIRTHHIAYLAQDMRLFPELTAMENIMLKNSITHHKSEQEIVAMMEQLGIGEKVNSPVAKLSIGQQQRVAIVRTLCQPCDFILLDEPVSHLDDANNQIVAQMVTREAQAQGAGIISTSVGNNVRINVDKEFKL